MKRTFIIALLLISLQFAFAAIPEPSPAPAKEENGTTAVVPQDMNNLQDINNLPAAEKRALMEQFSKMSLKDFEIISGRKLNMMERLSFRLTQNRMKHQLKRAEDLTSGFNIGGFALGFLLGLLGVLLAYIFSKDRNFRKWSWIGVGVLVVLSIILAVI